MADDTRVSQSVSRSTNWNGMDPSLTTTYFPYIPDPCVRKTVENYMRSYYIVRRHEDFIRRCSSIMMLDLPIGFDSKRFDRQNEYITCQDSGGNEHLSFVVVVFVEVSSCRNLFQSGHLVRENWMDLVQMDSYVGQKMKICCFPAVSRNETKRIALNWIELGATAMYLH